jgi:hypothetical protein
VGSVRGKETGLSLEVWGVREWNLGTWQTPRFRETLLSHYPLGDAGKCRDVGVFNDTEHSRYTGLLERGCGLEIDTSGLNAPRGCRDARLSHFPLGVDGKCRDVGVFNDTEHSRYTGSLERGSGLEICTSGLNEPRGSERHGSPTTLWVFPASAETSGFSTTPTSSTLPPVPRG